MKKIMLLALICLFACSSGTEQVAPKFEIISYGVIIGNGVYIEEPEAPIKIPQDQNMIGLIMHLFNEIPAGEQHLEIIDDKGDVFVKSSFALPPLAPCDQNQSWTLGFEIYIALGKYPVGHYTAYMWVVSTTDVESNFVVVEFNVF